MSERTFNPASADIDLATDTTCQDCGKERWEHRDGGMVYGLVCPDRSTPAEALICAACGGTDAPVVMVPLHPRCADTPAEALDALSNLVDAVTALENRSIRSGGEFHVWAEERMVTEARDEARALLARLRSPESD